MELGESPAATIARELDEETGLDVRADALVGCWSTRMRTYDNGDQVQTLAFLYGGSIVGGTERNDRTGEIEARGWFTGDSLPALDGTWRGHVQLVLTGAGQAVA